MRARGTGEGRKTARELQLSDGSQGWTMFVRDGVLYLAVTVNGRLKKVASWSASSATDDMPSQGPKPR